MKILSTGMSGLVGSRVREMLEPEFEFHDLNLQDGVDITDYGNLKKVFDATDAKVVIHMAAVTDVDGCEDEKILGEDSKSWEVNVTATENIARLSKKNGLRMIYISTDFVFNGVKGNYSETDEPDPVNWYARTKHEGEIAVSENSDNYAIARIAYPYRANFPQKKDFVRRILEKMRNNEEIDALTDHVITPTFIDDIANGLRQIAVVQDNGIFHLTGTGSIPVIEGVRLIGRIFGLTPKIKETDRKSFFKDRAFRPLNLSLKNDRITKLGIKMKSFEDGLDEMKRQILNNNL